EGAPDRRRHQPAPAGADRRVRARVPPAALTARRIVRAGTPIIQSNRSEGSGRRLLRPIMIEWDGKNVPGELRELPPGRYLVGPEYEIWDEDDLTPEEDAGIQQALDQIEAGEGIPYEEAMRQLRSQLASAGPHPLPRGAR